MIPSLVTIGEARPESVSISGIIGEGVVASVEAHLCKPGAHGRR